MKRNFREKIVDFVAKVLGVEPAKEVVTPPFMIETKPETVKLTAQFSLSERLANEYEEEEVKDIIVKELTKSIFEDFRNKFDKCSTVRLSNRSGHGTEYKAEILIVKNTED